MNPVSAELLNDIDRYIERLFVPPDPRLEQNLQNAEAAGLPSINVSAAEGKLLYLLTRIAGARRVLEIGTLGGYSTTWLARALPAGGTVVTLELDPKHADVARAQPRWRGPWRARGGARRRCGRVAPRDDLDTGRALRRCLHRCRQGALRAVPRARIAALASEGR